MLIFLLLLLLLYFSAPYFVSGYIHHIYSHMHEVIGICCASLYACR